MSERMLDGLLDAPAMARAHPGLFGAPSAAELDALQAGDFVKICRHNERFWLQIMAFSGPHIQALVANNLLDNDDLKVGAVVWVGREHVLETLKRSAQSGSS